MSFRSNTITTWLCETFKRLRIAIFIPCCYKWASPCTGCCCCNSRTKFFKTSSSGLGMSFLLSSPCKKAIWAYRMKGLGNIIMNAACSRKCNTQFGSSSAIGFRRKYRKNIYSVKHYSTDISLQDSSQVFFDVTTLCGYVFVWTVDEYVFGSVPWTRFKYGHSCMVNVVRCFLVLPMEGHWKRRSFKEKKVSRILIHSPTVTIFKQRWMDTSNNYSDQQFKQKTRRSG